MLGGDIEKTSRLLKNGFGLAEFEVEKARGR